MAATLTSLFRGLVHVVIVTIFVAIIWSRYIYRAPIATTLEPVTKLFGSDRNEPARTAAAVPASPDPVAPPAANNTLPSETTANTAAN